MSKRILALLLCAIMLIPCFSGCSEKLEQGDLGAYITMYLTDKIYDFDPANAYYSQEAQNIVGMMFDTLFKLSENGKVEKSLVSKYSINKEECTMELTLKDTRWSNGNPVTADDVVYAWKRLLRSDNNSPAASLLYDIKNARAVKEGDESIDDVGIEALSIDVVKVTFEGPIDYDQFMLNLTNVATAPLYENYVEKNADWAKKPSSMTTSGAYKLGKVVYVETAGENGKKVEETDDYALDQYNQQLLDKNGEVVVDDYTAKEISYFYLERNSYYYREDDEAINKQVKNYRILVDCSKSADDLLQDYKDGKIFYMGDIPLSIRNDAFVKEHAEVSNALSTFVCYFNETALINGEAIFANADVRNALSLAIDREAIQQAVVFGKAATGLVCPGIFNKGTSGDFREVGGDLIKTSDDVQAAKALLTKAGIEAGDYSFTIKVAAHDDVHIQIVEMIAAAWTELGFEVNIHKVHPIENNDYLKDLIGPGGTISKDDDPSPNDICDDLLIESIQRGNYEVVAFDYVAYSADAYSMLSNFANSFSGMKLIQGADETGAPTYALTPHVTGYTSTEYNDLIEAIYYLPYFASITEEQLADETFIFLSIYKEDNGDLTKDSHEEFLATYNKVKAIYEANDITPSNKTSDWAEQRAKLLHKGEELLLQDMPVVPVLFNENAVMVRDEISDVSATYYIPSQFAKSNLEDYAKYIEAFAEFPEVNWDLVED